MRKLKVAVIGIGYLGKFHAEKFIKNKYTDLVGVVDIDQKKCIEIKNKFNTNTFSNYKSIVDKVDAVSIVVPTNLHYRIAKYFIENNKHVFIEKPFTDSILKAEKLEKLSKEKKIILQIGHIERFNKGFLLLNNRIKKPLFVECNRISPFKVRGTEVDVIMDLMIHDLDIIFSLIKSKIKDIKANGVEVLTNSIDIAHARITFNNGCICNLSSSRISNKVERKMRVFQKNEYFSLDYQKCILESYKKIKNDNINSIFKEQKKFLNNDPLNEEIKSFINCILNNKKPIVSAFDGKNALKYAITISQLIKK